MTMSTKLLAARASKSSCRLFPRSTLHVPSLLSYPHCTIADWAVGIAETAPSVSDAVLPFLRRLKRYLPTQSPVSVESGTQPHTHCLLGRVAKTRRNFTRRRTLVVGGALCVPESYTAIPIKEIKQGQARAREAEHIDIQLHFEMHHRMTAV